MRLALALALILAAAAGLAQAQAGAQLRPWTGGPAPALSLQNLDGRPVRLEDYRGKVVLLNFWATWCEPCREEMPSMNKLRAAFAGRPFEVLAVNLGEGEPRIKRFLEQVPLDFPVLLDRDSAAAKAWRVRVLPASFLIGPDGRIRYSVLGEYNWSQESVRSAIGALLVPGVTQPRAGLSASFP